jgi:hypothetical protein
MLVLMVLPMASAAAATPSPNYVEVSGVITNNKNEVYDAKVTVKCNNHTQVVSSNHFGDYTDYFSSRTCAKSDVVTVIASKGSASGESMGKVSATCVHVYVNVPLMSANLPELTAPTAIAAIGLSGVGYFSIRRRFQSAISRIQITKE